MNDFPCSIPKDLPKSNKKDRYIEVFCIVLSDSLLFLYLCLCHALFLCVCMCVFVCTYVFHVCVFVCIHVCLMCFHVFHCIILRLIWKYLVGHF